MTWNKDRKQTYMDTRGGNTWHTQQNPDITPPSRRLVPSLNSPSGRGGGTLEAPQDKYGQEHRTGTYRVEQTDRDHGGAGALEAMAVQGAQGCHGGAGSSGGHGGAGSSGGHGGCRELWRPWQMVFGGLGHGQWAPTAGTLTTPPPKFPWGSEGVSGALRG